MKKRIDVIASEESFGNLSTFTNIEDMNKTVRTYREVIKESLIRSDVQARLIALLEVLKRHSCKQIGVSYMCKNTIAAKLEVSYKSVQRLMKKLENLRMIRQIAMKRKKDMRQTANAIQIIPAKNDVSDKKPPKKSGKCPTIKTTSPSLKQKINNTRNDVPSKEISAANFVAHWVPENFANFAKSYYPEARTIEEFWKVVKQSNRVIDCFTGKRAFTATQETQIAVTAFKGLVMKIKSGVNLDNVFGYFNGIVNKLMDKYYFDTEFMND